MGSIIDDLAEAMHEPDGRTIAEMIAADDYDDIIVEKVEPHEDGSGATICWDGGTCCGVSGAVPAVGDIVRFYGGASLGQQHHGWALNGKLITWRTPFERVLDRVEWFATHDREKREKFAQQVEQLDRDYNALPAPLQARIDRFRAKDPAFRIDDEWGELFIATEAARIADRVRFGADVGLGDAPLQFWSGTELRDKAAGGRSGTVWETEPDTDAERYLLWAWALNTPAYDYDHERQKEVLGISDGHSGFSFSTAMQLAWRLLRGEEV